MPSSYVNNFDLVGGIILSPRALPGVPSLTSNYAAERAAAVANAIAAADAALEEHKRAAAAALVVAGATRESTIASAKATAAGVIATRATALLSTHDAAIRPLLKAWLFDNATNTLADSIVNARAAWLLDTQEQCGEPFRQQILLVCADILAAGNAGGDGPRTMTAAAGMRQFAASAIYDHGTGLVGELDRSLRTGGSKAFVAMQKIEAWLFDRLQQAAGMSGAPLTTFNALLACGTAAQARAVLTVS